MFDVVMLKKASPGAHAAKPEDFKRVRIEAADSFSARYAESVEAAAKEGEGWVILHVTVPGQLTQSEMEARARSHSTSAEQSKQTVRSW